MEDKIRQEMIKSIELMSKIEPKPLMISTWNRDVVKALAGEGWHISFEEKINEE